MQSELNDPHVLVNPFVVPSRPFHQYQKQFPNPEWRDFSVHWERRSRQGGERLEGGNDLMGRRLVVTDRTGIGHVADVARASHSLLMGGAPTRQMTQLDRAALVRRGQWLSRLTLAYNSLEGVAAVVAGAMAGSVSLVGFGIDSVIEVASSAAALWRLRSDKHDEKRERSERITLRIVGLSFIALAFYVALDAARALWKHEPPERTVPGIVIAALSVIVMPLLARQKRAVAVGLGSRALEADATQTDLCMYLSAIVLVGLLLNAIFGWWWADPVAALIMVPIIAKEGVEGVRGEKSCDDCAPT